MKKKRHFILLPLLVILLGFFTVFAHTFILNIVKGCVHFPEEHYDAELKMEDGKSFHVLRRLKVEGKNNGTEGNAVFIVRFRFEDLKLEINKNLSMIPAPFLINMEGFREKYWTFNEDTDWFQGIYQWESREAAEKYPDSFIFKLMTKRSAQGTLFYKIIPNNDLSEYIEKLLSE